MSQRPRARWLRLFAVFVALGLIAAACGSGDDSAGDGDTTADEPATETTGEGEDADSAADAEEDDGGTGDGDASTTEEDPEAVEDDMVQPIYGGDLTVLLEAETDTWDIPNANCATSCITIMRQVGDPLTAVNADGDVVPFLLSAFEPNEDFTSFTLTMRENVMFHDGTIADGAAVLRNLQEMAAGLLQGQVVIDLDPDNGLVLVDDMTVEVNFTRPFSSFGNNIAERTGWLLSPAYWDDPERAGKTPIATGAFEMVEWTTGEQTVVQRNENYWRTDSEGRQLPYLDSITFRPVPDQATRRATMEAGDADVNADSFGENQEFWEGDWLDSGGQLVVPAPDRSTTYLLLNNAEGSPFANADLRRALALCTNRDEYILLREPRSQIANGPFSPGVPGYVEDPGFPGFDADAGNALLDEIGRPEKIVYGTTNVPSNLVTAQLFADQWSRNCDLNVEIDQFDQSELITKAILGQFEVFLWRNHGQGVPGLEFVWWHSRHAEGLALNFGRIRDPELDALLEQSWTTTDLNELDSIAQQITQVFADQVYNLWLNYQDWWIPYRANVHGVDQLSLPGGGSGRGSIDGRFHLTEAWKS